MWEIDLGYRPEFEETFLRIEEKAALLKKNRPLPQAALQKIRESLAIEWTYHSNSIEGNTLSLRETQMVLQEGITVKGKSLREHFEAFNHEKAIDLLYKIVHDGYRLRCIDILSLHALVLRSIEDESAGRIRNAGIRITGANFAPPGASKVSGLLDALVAYIEQNPQQLNTLELATVFHHKLVWIHPFFDGNGRTARLAMNLLLLRDGYPPAIILKDDRKKYYEALNQANTGNYQKLTLLMAQAAERTLNIYLQALPGQEEDYMDISDLVKEPDMPYGQEYISLLARQGKIDAYKEGRSWVTSKRAVSAYMAKLRRRPQAR